MICPKCNNNIPDGIEICPVCSTNTSTNIPEQPTTNVTPIDNNPVSQVEPASEPVNTSSSPNIIVIIIALLIVGGIGYVLIAKQNLKLKANREADTISSDSKKENAKTDDSKKEENKKEEEKEEEHESPKNYRINMTIYMEVDGTRIKQTSSGTVDEVHQREHLNAYTSLNGAGVSSEMYYDYITGDIYISDPENPKVWTKQKGATDPVDQEYILSRLKNNSGIEVIDENHYRVKLSSNEIKRLIGSTDYDLSPINGDTYVDVYKENGYVVKLEYDFSEAYDGIDVFEITIKYSAFNQVGDITIPQEVLDGVKKV